MPLSGRPQRTDHELVLHEEELRLGQEVREYGAVRARKRIETEAVDEMVPRAVEEAQIERAEANEDDSGEIEELPDGAISIPVLEEELVVTKRVVVRERIVIRRETTTEYEQVLAQLRMERVEIDPASEASSEEV